MKYGLVLLLIFFIGCYRSEPDIVYVPVSIPSYGESVESVYEPERFECNCDNYHDNEHECYGFDYEYECEPVEPEYESDKYLYNTSTGEEIWVNEIGGGEYMDYETGEIYFPLDNSGFLYQGTDGKLYESYY